ncbi:dTDP-4-dehydrorhamnose 3,5-epimerase [Coleofasciculus chthonoplastes]|uniref:dTDP-4-dehydrorhamnose 3,5-epimerase n=1 Tax=Coleofasciculus TaxID=669368 RepID=UPI0032F15ABA
MSNRFSFQPTSLSGLLVAKRQANSDHRGEFSRMYCIDELSRVGFGKTIVQINHSLTRSKGTVRGLHFQYPPYAEAKIVSCLQGEVFDVAVDLRKGSPTFVHWYGEVLSADNYKSLCIPEGFAHGFQTLTDDCELLYLHTSSYQPEFEGGLHVQDPDLNIAWPLPIMELSQRDRAHPFIHDSQFGGVCL